MQVTSIKQAEYFVEHFLGIHSVNFDGIKDIRVLNEIVDALVECLEFYPEIAHSICHIGNPDDINAQMNMLANSFNKKYLHWKIYDDTDGAFAVFSASFQESRKPVDYIGLSIRPYISDNTLERINYDNYYAADQGLYTSNCSTIKSSIWHEVGHVLDNIMKVSTDSKFLSMIKNANIKEEISEYAMINQRETFAEAFAEYHAALDSSILIEAIGEYADRKYKVLSLKKPQNFELSNRFKIGRQ